MSWFKDLIEIDYISAVVVKKGITDVTNRFDFFFGLIESMIWGKRDRFHVLL